MDEWVQAADVTKAWLTGVLSAEGFDFEDNGDALYVHGGLELPVSMGVEPDQQIVVFLVATDFLVQTTDDPTCTHELVNTVNECNPYLSAHHADGRLLGFHYVSIPGGTTRSNILEALRWTSASFVSALHTCDTGGVTALGRLLQSADQAPQ